MANESMVIGYDTTFELSEFKKPRIRSEVETAKNVILFILFAKKGQYPSLPMIGMDIESLLFSFYDEIDCDGMKNEIIEQCAALKFYFESSILSIKKMIYKDMPSLVISISGKESYPPNYMRDHIATNSYIIGISFDKLNRLIYGVEEGVWLPS